MVCFMLIPIERVIVLADGEDLMAIHLVAILHQLRTTGQVAMQMQGGKVPRVSRIAREVLDISAEGLAICVVMNDREHDLVDSVWQNALV